MKKIIKLLANNQNSFRDFVAIILFKLKLIPKEFEGRVRSIYLTKRYNKNFRNLKLEYDKSGFHFLSPMPSEEYLKKYYKDTYWPSRTDKEYPIRLRDIEHFKLLKKKFPEFNLSRKKILNFGAGHGGLSFFLHTANHDIYNFEPGGINNYFDNRWNNVKEIESLDFKFDLIYASHSLEHVGDIKKVLSNFKKISHENTIFFFEVPNCYKNDNLKIEPPHTYYFKRKFFFNHFVNANFCKTFKDYKDLEDDSGEVIILLSKANIRI
jgi:2-polyprenyl-3-methyl-5-hydroxy-6-metoxy-1,4-benzoquinol methylase